MYSKKHQFLITLLDWPYECQNYFYNTIDYD